MVNNVLPEPYYRLGKPSTYTTCHCIEFSQNLWPLLRNLSCSQDQDHIHSTYICYSYTGGTQKHVFHPPKMFYSYTGNRHKNMLDRINAPSYCKCLSWKFSIAERETWAMQKLFIKERKRKSIKKMDKCPWYWKQWVLRCPPKKEKKERENRWIR